MKPDRWINWTVVAIDLINISWSLVGVYLNKSYADPRAEERGAIDACSKDYGLLVTFAAFMLVFFGLFQTARMALYIAFVICHRYILGNWEARARTALNKQFKQPINISFHTSSFQAGAEDMCSICCLNYIENDKLIIVPCEGKHRYHMNCIKEWLQRSNECPLCKCDVVKI